MTIEKPSPPAQPDIHNNNTFSPNLNPSRPNNDLVKIYSKTLFVGNLAPTVTGPMLTKIYEEYGPLQNVKYIEMKHMAFITYEGREDAEEAKKLTHGLPVEGRQLKVGWGKIGLDTNNGKEQFDWGNGIGIVPRSSLHNFPNFKVENTGDAEGDGKKPPSSPQKPRETTSHPNYSNKIQVLESNDRDKEEEYDPWVDGDHQEELPYRDHGDPRSKTFPPGHYRGYPEPAYLDHSEHGYRGSVPDEGYREDRKRGPDMDSPGQRGLTEDYRDVNPNKRFRELGWDTRDHDRARDRNRDRNRDRTRKRSRSRERNRF